MYIVDIVLRGLLSWVAIFRGLLSGVGGYVLYKDIPYAYNYSNHNLGAIAPKNPTLKGHLPPQYAFLCS